MTSAGSPVIFIHGLWLHATSWGPWMELFQTAGYVPLAPGWPGEPDTVEESRSQPDLVAGKGIDDVVGHYTQIIHGLDAKPVVIGHSFGGLIAQRLLGDDLAAAAVAIDAAPIKGVVYLPPSALRVASIALRKPANRNGAVALTSEQFRYGFANALPSPEANFTSGGRSRPRASRSSKPLPPTSPGSRRPRSTRATRPAGRSC
jgi:non-heme chloroperoxidase